jgi:DNA-binding beta-propeller fold protein YncE
VAVGPTGTVYVTDPGNARVQRFTPSGGFLGTWGGFTDEATLRSPHGVAIQRDGTLLVADTENHRIVRLGPELDVLGTWGGLGAKAGEFQSPHGVAVAPDGTVYVADWGNGRLQRFTPEGRVLGAWGQVGPWDPGLPFAPRDVGITRDGEVLVFTDNRIDRYTADGRRLGGWTPPGGFGARAGVGFGPDGRVYSITGRWQPDEPQVRIFDRKGTLLAAWGRRALGPPVPPGQLFDPTALAVDAAGRVYVADGASARVVVFRADGTFVHEWDRTTAPGLQFPRGLAVDRQGRVYVADGPALLRLGPVPGR